MKQETQFPQHAYCKLLTERIIFKMEKLLHKSRSHGIISQRSLCFPEHLFYQISLVSFWKLSWGNSGLIIFLRIFPTCTRQMIMKIKLSTMLTCFKAMFSILHKIQITMEVTMLVLLWLNGNLLIYASTYM